MNQLVKVKRMMETDDTGVQRQFMPITHVSAVLGLENITSGQSKVHSKMPRFLFEERLIKNFPNGE